jgi:hypothetical protein
VVVAAAALRERALAEKWMFMNHVVFLIVSATQGHRANGSLHLTRLIPY